MSEHWLYDRLNLLQRQSDRTSDRMDKLAETATKLESRVDRTERLIEMSIRVAQIAIVLLIVSLNLGRDAAIDLLLALAKRGGP